MIAAGMIVLASCSWAHPGLHKMRGNVESAVAHYADIPAAAQDELRGKIAKVKPDDIAYIYKGITVGRGGQYDYSAPRDMHFGAKSVCREVRMNSWDDEHYEIALVYCSGEHCLLVPRVCRNVARVYRAVAVRSATAPRDDANLTAGGRALLTELGLPGRARVPESISPYVGKPLRYVPEPSSAALSLTALLAAGILRGAKARKHGVWGLM